LTDTFKTLWAGWVIEEVTDNNTAGRQPTKVYFGGDTGYRSVMDGEKEDEVPVCPAFETIGKVFGGFDLALIPIGLVFNFFLPDRDGLLIILNLIALTCRGNSCLLFTVLPKIAYAYSKT